MDSNLELSARTVLETLIDRLTAPFARRGRATRTAESLARAHLDLRPQEWYAIRAGFPAAVFLVLALVQPFLGLALLLAVVAYFIPAMALTAVRKRRHAEAVGQLPEALSLMARALHGGAAVAQAIQGVSEAIPTLIGEEFARVGREVELGVPMEKALDRMATRLDSPDFAMVVTAIQINRQMGGSLAEVLESVTETMRDRVRLRERVRVLTAQVRTSSRILTVLPFAVGLILLVVAYPYMQPILTTAAGYVVIAISLMLMVLAYFFLGRIADIEV
jgi:tight adherence protein B